VVVAQGDVFWADLPEPTGSGPGLRRPVLIVQGDAFNRSRIATAIVIPLTSNLRLAMAPGNVILPSRTTGLPRNSVANVSQIITIDRQLLTERAGHVSQELLRAVLSGVDVVLGREIPPPK
jgi:mRNA interferase MazF